MAFASTVRTVPRAGDVPLTGAFPWIYWLGRFGTSGICVASNSIGMFLIEYRRFTKSDVCR